MYRRRERLVVDGRNAKRDGNLRTKPNFQNIYRVTLLSSNTHYFKTYKCFWKKKLTCGVSTRWRRTFIKKKYYTLLIIF